MEYTTIIKEVEDGWYMGQCEQIPGAITQGQTIEEVEENMKEAIALMLEAEREHYQERYKGKKIIRRKIAVL
jgi:predicted RNase H-like HicB family nuclease